MTQFDKLPQVLKEGITKRCLTRIERQRLGFPGATVLIVGDRPAPSAPDTPTFHYTPFATIKHSSLFINLELENAGIDERKLAWVNAASFHDERTSSAVLDHDWKLIVALGDAAQRWVNTGGKTCVKITHPAYHKRFKSREVYPLVSILKECNG